MQIHTYIFLVVKKCTHEHDCSIKSEASVETNYDQDLSSINGAGLSGTGGGTSEHSNETEYADHKDSLLFDKYRKLLSKHGIYDKDQQFILRLLHEKPENERKLFLRYDILFQYFYYRFKKFNFNACFKIDKIFHRNLEYRGDNILL